MRQSRRWFDVSLTPAIGCQGHPPRWGPAALRILRQAQAPILGMLLFLLAGCSTVRLVYNQADTILSWMVDDYFDLDTPQRQDFNARLDPLLKWHRQEQLPDYIKFLAETKQRGQRSFTRDDALWLVEGTKARYRTIADKGAQDATELLATLAPENIRALEKHFEKVNQKFAREYKLNGTSEDRRRARIERTLKRIREWTGTLTRAQEERITALSDTIPYSDHRRHQDRQRRQKEFIALLNTRHNKAEFTSALRAWLSDWEKGRPAEMHAAINDGFDKRITLYLEVERMLTPEQRAHVLQKLQDYIDDLNALVARRVAVR